MLRKVRSCVSKVVVVAVTVGASMHSIPVEAKKTELTEEERTKILHEITFATQKMWREIEAAKRCAERITQVDVRDAVVDAIKGFVAGGAGGPKAAATGALLGAVGNILSHSYCNAADCLAHLRQADRYAEHADRLEEYLWTH